MPRASNRGGRNPRAGRKPGAAYQAAPLAPQSAAESPVHGGVRQRAVTASDSQIRAVAALHARGLAVAELARRFNRDDDTIRRWLQARPDIVEEEARRIVDPHEFLSPMLPLITGAYRDLLDPSVEAAIRAQMARDAADRLFGKPVIRAVHDIRERIEVVFVDERDG